MGNLLRGTPFDGKVEVRGTVGSTNDDLRVLAALGAPQWTVVVAERQTAGRGRHGRRWHSAAGSGLYLSVLLRPRQPLEHVGRHTLAVSVAIAEACRSSCGVEVRIKWPNDLIHDGLKLGGVLAELRSSTRYGPELVVGTGVNVDLSRAEIPPELAGIATSLRIASGRSMLDRERLAGEYLLRLERIATLMDGEGWPEVRRRWLALSPGANGDRVRVTSDHAGGSEQFDGRTAGIDDSGALVVRRSDGALVTVSSPHSVSPLGE
ncbi:MAG TPA: biotin--[acetyl-CoA-carboxylase] ligase [Candidatus Polarisedimenticolaceae bacterium]|nr:biotin--[acetyl-CoA-carboxylase] ligase [Candidatus Polarisedimenticolaceae bacterium]